MLAVCDSKHIGHGWCWEGLATVLIGGEGSDGSVDGVWECCQKRKCNGMHSCCHADHKALSLRVGGKRSVRSSSQVWKTEKNLAYQLAQDPLIWAAYMP